MPSFWQWASVAERAIVSPMYGAITFTTASTASLVVMSGPNGKERAARCQTGDRPRRTAAAA